MPRELKNLEISVLMDHYGALLTEKQRAILDEYYNQDLSLAEIAENSGISRQGVRDAVQHGSAALQEYEEKLGCAARAQKVRADFVRMEQLTRSVRCENAGPYPRAARIEADTAELLQIINRFNTLPQEDADGI